MATEREEIRAGVFARQQGIGTVLHRQDADPLIKYGPDKWSYIDSVGTDLHYTNKQVGILIADVEDGLWSFA